MKCQRELVCYCVFTGFNYAKCKYLEVESKFNNVIFVFRLSFRSIKNFCAIMDPTQNNSNIQENTRKPGNIQCVKKNGENNKKKKYKKLNENVT